MKYILLICLAVGMMACRAKKADEDEEAAPNVQPVVAVKVSGLARGDIATTVTATGKTDAARKEKIFAPVAGRLVTFNVLDGQAVRKGELLATIRTKESQAAIDGAEALLGAAKTPEQKADAQKNIDLALASQANVEVRVKFDGVIANRLATQGELVGENAELATIIDLATIYFFASVPIRDLPSVHRGERSTLEFPSLPGRAINGEVDAVSPQSDLQSQTVPVRIRFTSLPAGFRNDIKTEMMGTAHIVTGIHRDVLIAPKKALIRNDETNEYSVVAVLDSIARIFPITVGTMNDSTAEVTGSDLKAGMSVVIEGGSTLADSMHVKIEGGRE